jgi:hypothetical protein
MAIPLLSIAINSLFDQEIAETRKLSELAVLKINNSLTKSHSNDVDVISDSGGDTAAIKRDGGDRSRILVVVSSQLFPVACIS